MLKEFPKTHLRRRMLGGPLARKPLRLKLAMQRQDTSLLDREIAAASGEIVQEREDWVDAFVDYSHVISLDKGKTRAIRAVAMHDGTLFWLVRKTGKARGFHSDRPDPLAAIEQAEAAWRARKLVRRNWEAVQELARDLLLGRRRFRVRLEDAHASPLCSMGIAAFMRRMCISQITETPGWFAAVLMRIDPQVGFVIHQAYLRETRSTELSGMVGLSTTP
ncbi:MAG: hypothetical protein AAF636_25070 [Pseudomonadota bacterium]